MPRPIPQIGGCFAPPLTDELLTSYDAKINNLEPQSRARDILQKLLALVWAWWNLPESNGKASRGPFGAMAMPLDPKVAEELAELTPWTAELQAYEAALDELDRDAANRNSMKLDGWRQAIADHYMSQAFKGENIATVRSALRFYTRVKTAIDKLSMGTLGGAAAAGALAVAYPGYSKSWIDEAGPKAKVAWNATVAAYRSPKSAPIPRPDLEATPLRDLAFHLLWHAKELAGDTDEEMGREPVTADKVAL